MKPAISVQNLGKSYRISHASPRGGYKTLRESLSHLAAAPLRRLKGGDGAEEEEFWALKEVSFDVQPGEVVGIIGRNGAGKSTLLKMLSRITKPTRGSIELRGRVGSLLEVGTGFHPELTGRENVYLNGAILGMSSREIASKFDAIVDFSGVEKFLDTPVKRYSSGMYVRLAFAVAAHLDLEILMVDEVLAVGDLAFQQKCLGRMGELAHSGRTVLLVSHNLPMLSNLCTRAVWLDRGQLLETGPSAEIIAVYCKQSATLVYDGNSVSLVDHPGRPPGYHSLFERVTLLDEDGSGTCSVPMGGTLTVELEFSRIPQRADTGIVVDICDQFGTVLARANSRVQSRLNFGEERCQSVRCTCDNFRLLPGSYLLNLGLGDGSDYLDKVDGAIRFSVEPADIYGTGQVPSSRSGFIALETHWAVNRTAERDEVALTADHN